MHVRTQGRFRGATLKVGGGEGGGEEGGGGEGLISHSTESSPAPPQTLQELVFRITKGSGGKRS